MTSSYHTYWVADMNQHQYFQHTLSLYGPVQPAPYMVGMPQQYNTSACSYPAAHAAPKDPPPDYEAVHSRQNQSHLPPSNHIFIPSSMDIARGRVNQAVHDARWNHEYVDNTTRALKARARFDWYFGTDPKSLGAWQDLAFYCGQDPTSMPTSIRGCKIFLRTRYVNIFDFISAVDNFMQENDRKRGAEGPYRMSIPTFKSAKKLEHYTRKKGLICPAKAGRGNDLFRFMLARWF